MINRAMIMFYYAYCVTIDNQLDICQKEREMHRQQEREKEREREEKDEYFRWRER